MHATVAADLAKEVFELAFFDAQGRVVQRKRLGRKAFPGSFRLKLNLPLPPGVARNDLDHGEGFGPGAVNADNNSDPQAA